MGTQDYLDQIGRNKFLESKNKLMIQPKETYHRLTERNSWEGETWYHYFLDGPEVLQTLVSTLARLNDHDFSDVIETIQLSDDYPS